MRERHVGLGDAADAARDDLDARPRRSTASISESRSASALPCTSALMTDAARSRPCHRPSATACPRASSDPASRAWCRGTCPGDTARLRAPCARFRPRALIAGIRRARQAEHHDRQRRAGFGHRLTVLVEHRAHAAELLAGDDRIARLAACRACTSTVATGAAALFHARLDHDAGREAVARRLQLEHFGLQQDGVEQLVDALAGPRRHVDEHACRRPSPRAARCAWPGRS